MQTKKPKCNHKDDDLTGGLAEHAHFKGWQVIGRTPQMYSVLCKGSKAHCLGYFRCLKEMRWHIKKKGWWSNKIYLMHNVDIIEMLEPISQKESP